MVASNERKPYGGQTLDERITALDKIQNVLHHADWRELYLRWTDEAADMQRQMDGAPDWEIFVAARAVKLYIKDRLLNLRELVSFEKTDLEETRDVAPPTDYEPDL